jgi:RNA polymerase sigma factor (TIGR02999 family)
MTAAYASSVPGITQWLVRWREGDEQALDRLTRLVYAELRHLAAAILRKEAAGHTLQATALVHELYLRLTGAQDIDWQCRGQFFAVSAKLMRQILVDHARKRAAGKRGGGCVGLDREALEVPGPDVIQVDASLSRLAKEHPRQAAVVELRFFGGLTAQETVEALQSSGQDVSLRTVERDWKFARAWLQNEIAR